MLNFFVFFSQLGLILFFMIGNFIFFIDNMFLLRFSNNILDQSFEVFFLLSLFRIFSFLVFNDLDVCILIVFHIDAMDSGFTILDS